MTENDAITIVQNYIQNHKFTPIRIDVSKLSSGKKSPDLEVKENGEIVFYCEVKTPELRPNPQTQMFHWTTTHSKIRDFIHKAVKQFKDQDTSHSLPWVVVFTSDHFQLNWSNFTHCIQGTVAYNSQVIKDLGGQRFIQETEQDIKAIDLFIWCQVNSMEKKIYQMVHFVNSDSPLLEKTKIISDKLTPLASDDIMDKNSRKYA